MNMCNTHPSRKALLRFAFVVTLVGAGAPLAFAVASAQARERVTTVTGA
jgi:hypothetical protein